MDHQSKKGRIAQRRQKMFTLQTQREKAYSVHQAKLKKINSTPTIFEHKETNTGDDE